MMFLWFAIIFIATGTARAGTGAALDTVERTRPIELSGRQAERLYAALQFAGVKITREGAAKRIKLAHLNCTEAGVNATNRVRYYCDEPPVRSSKKAKAIIEAMKAIGITGGTGNAVFSYEITDLMCVKKNSSGVRCKITAIEEVSRP